MKDRKAILVVYGEGGHESEMKRLLHWLPGINRKGISKVAYTEGNASKISGVDAHFACKALRDKKKRRGELNILKKSDFQPGLVTKNYAQLGCQGNVNDRTRNSHRGGVAS